jgi:ribosomal protein L11 methyltransferase
MSWLQLQIRTTRDQAEALEDLLLEAGAVSVTLLDAEDEPLFEPGVGETPLWSELLVTGLFPGECDAGVLAPWLQARWPGSLPDLSFSILEDQNWERAWLDDFKPLHFGSRLWVCPSWWKPPSDTGTPDSWQPDPEAAAAWENRNAALLVQMQAPGNIVLQLDPGLAFGTGTHPTTSLCLQWLDSQDLTGTTLVDYGCGSGILGLAALMLGAGKVYGVDNDPQALLATADNCRKNAVDPAAFPVYLPRDFAGQLASGKAGPVDGMMANILAGTLIELAELLCLQVRYDGWLLLSGILCEQADAVIDAFTPWCTGFEVRQEGDWVSINALRRQS